MKRLSLLLCAVCVCSVLLSVFSVTANAEELNDFYIRQDIYYIKPPSNIVGEYWLTFTPGDGNRTFEEWEFDSRSFGGAHEEKHVYRTAWNIFFNNTFPYELNKVNRVTLENYYYAYLIDEPKGLHYVRGVGDGETVYIVIEYTDGSTEQYTPDVTVDSDNSIDMTFSFTPRKNVNRMTVFVDSDISTNLLEQAHDFSTRFTVTGYLGEFKGDTKHNFVLEIQSEEAGLLSGLLGWVQNIFGKIGDTFDKIVEIFAEIKELPSKIWGYIENGLKALFIPTSEDIEQFSDKMDTLLESKLGAVYQVSNTVIESWERIQESDETDTINFPEVTINLPENNTFSFGGYNVKIVPDGFSFIVTSVKMVVGIVCTIAFINGLRKKYDDVMEG